MSKIETAGAASLADGLAEVPPPKEPDAIALDTTGSASEYPAESWFILGGKLTVRNVGAATLTPVLPESDNATGAAALVVPGGGFVMASMENEGWPQARWLADRGIAAFVLKYRLEPTPASMPDFQAAMIQRFASARLGRGEQRKLTCPDCAITDARAALELVRARHLEWGIDRDRIGYLGFSAGALLGLHLATDPGSVARPAFLGAIYPSMNGLKVPGDAPPLFCALATDDPLFGDQDYDLPRCWKQAGRPVEFHLYERGGHGYGMGTAGTTTIGTMASFYAWMQAGGWLRQKKKTL